MSGARKLKIGVAGLGRAFAFMLPTFLRDPRVELVAAADTREEARLAFARQFGGKVYADVGALCANPAIDIVYVATPHQKHAAHAIAAARNRKHILVEKPMALTLEDCAAMIEAAREAGVFLLVGHSHSFDAPIARTRALIDSGAFGAVRMITALNYTDYLYRPRRPEELDTARGGGAIFNQAAHQVDIVRLLAGARVSSVRAATGTWDRGRPTEGAYAALLTFEGAFASLTYNGYGHFDSDEWQNGIGEMGQAKRPGTAASRLRFATPDEEAAFKNARNYGGEQFAVDQSDELSHQHFGPVIVSCEKADLRPTPDGVLIHQNGASRLEPLPKPAVPRSEVIDELYGAVIDGRAPVHDGQWAMATLEVCLAILQSAQTGKDMTLGRPSSQ